MKQFVFLYQLFRAFENGRVRSFRKAVVFWMMHRRVKSNLGTFVAMVNRGVKPNKDVWQKPK